MSSLPRIDQVETAIKDQLEDGTILKQLTNELIEELEALDLIRPLLKARVKTIVLSYKVDDNDTSENTTTPEEVNQNESWLKQLSKAWNENQIDRYYLERRDSFERVTFELFRTKSKGVAMEAYQRLVENEESWQMIVERWGMQAEKNSQGRYHQIPANKINQHIYHQLKRLEVGETSQPFRYGKILGITKLIQWNQLQLNAQMRERLETELFNHWLDDQVSDILKTINTAR